MQKRDIIVVGSSAGGLPALIKLVAGLPSRLDAAVFILRHFPPAERSELASFLSTRGPVRATEATHGESIIKGRIYVAPPGRQMVLKLTTIILEETVLEKCFRPTIDALFASAAAVFGRRVIGIILSGLLDDGAKGLSSVRAAGGISIVQTPGDATFKDMPANAIRLGSPDFTVPAADISTLLTTLV